MQSCAHSIRPLACSFSLQSLSRAVARISKDLLVVTLAEPSKPAKPPPARGGSGTTTEAIAAEHETWHALFSVNGVVLTPDCTDVDPPISRALVDARHTFLEMCQVSTSALRPFFFGGRIDVGRHPFTSNIAGRLYNSSQHISHFFLDVCCSSGTISLTRFVGRSTRQPWCSIICTVRRVEA